MGVSNSKILDVCGIGKRYGAVWAVRDATFSVYQGETLVLLGPSGCGKSTTLRMIAGLERPESGQIFLNGKTIFDIKSGLSVAPEDRHMGMVFQMFAIWPHMSVADHIAFPLELGRVRNDEKIRLTQEVLSLVGLEGLEKRRATELSGGQQQRLVLARALVYRPELVLLDEPLSNLDAKLRATMRRELKDLQQRVGATFIFVTHDQVEAMTLATRIVVMREGRIEQIGTPREIYEKPATRFVESFVGSVVSFEGDLTRDGRDCLVELEGGFRMRIPPGREDHDLLGSSGRVSVSVRPEHVTVVPEARDPEVNEIAGILNDLNYLGHRWELTVQACGVQLDVEIASRAPPAIGQRLLLRVDPGAVRLWPA